jgi:predicted RNase H-like HicB family nuclease
MNFGILFEKIDEKDFPAGYYYAHIPSLGLTTHGLGLDGARHAAFDLARAWLSEKKAHGDSLPAPSEILFSTLDIPDDALQGA